ncbi:AarF/ABC1/UbiB kinase family protein [Bacillus shivajii]|uniref:ABC1 kinase family protein n=1 Tax=Bacillus shivajii TaxID=1983719 RepID=UPI001CF9BD55|nr:lipopolysaccharide core heptose(II) kinase RfaY [Bacillus shivajii]UCZ54251.1 AarF/ABC1/UbiB kinase family protein [Bacillus shivajii]
MKNNSLYRITVIVLMFIKFIFQLYLFNKRNKDWDSTTHESWEELLRKQASEYRDKSLHLEGLMIKVGQFLSTRADILPEAFLEELADLIDQVPPVPAHISKSVLKKEWGRDIDDYLSHISEKPYASASIGEVYKGTLHNGQEVAIKIQRHNIDKIIKTDFKALRIVLWITRKFTSFGKQADTKALYKEMVRTIGNELNYYKELKNANYFRQRFQNDPNIYIPQFYEEYSTKRVLVMEWIDAHKVTDITFLKKNQIDREQLAKQTFHFFVEQLLDHGMFHADPHPGNILVTKDGTLIILDFGMVGNVNREDSIKLRKMIEGFVLEDYSLVINQLEELGFLLAHANKHKLQTILRNTVEAYLQEDVRKLDQDIIEEIFSEVQELVQEQPIQLPAEFAFLGRAASIVLGVLTIIDPDIDFIELGKPVVKGWLDETNDEQGHIQLQVLKESAKPLLSVPRNLNQWLEFPKYQRKSEEQRELQRFDHQRSLLIITMVFTTFFISLVFLFVAITFMNLLLISITATIGAISLTCVILLTRKHRKWVKTYRDNNFK